jgi:hypothetical protein
MIDAKEQAESGRRFGGIIKILYQKHYILWADRNALWCINRDNGETIWYKPTGPYAYSFDDVAVSLIPNVTEKQALVKYSFGASRARGALVRCGQFLGITGGI